MADDLFWGKIYLTTKGNSAFVPHGIHAHDASIGSIATVYLPTRMVESYGPMVDAVGKYIMSHASYRIGRVVT